MNTNRYLLLLKASRLAKASGWVAVLGVWLAFSGVANAQDNTTRRLQELEQRVIELTSEVQILKARLEAILGPVPQGEVFDIPVGRSPVLGPSTAPLTLVVFMDYESDYSARALFSIRQLMELYPQSIKLVIKHYPLPALHPNAANAALAAIAAQRQRRFWEYHELLLSNRHNLSDATYLMLAEEWGLNATRLDADRRSLAVLEILTEDERLAEKLNVRGVPTLFLNGRRLADWSFEYLKQQVEALLPSAN